MSGLGKKVNKKGGMGIGEVQQQKSPAEFFAEHQAIAGFDNMGKALYTSIRELIENSLDACESIGQLPTISVVIEELDQKEFNEVRGISNHEAEDVALFADRGSSNSSKRKSSGSNGNTGGTTTAGSKDEKTSSTAGGPRKQEGYFIIKVKDNGCGMSHAKIPDLLGRVLSGSKYGVRQTRGKFGLGAKMALIWSKKSTGVPITITTAHRPTANSPNPPPYISTCVLDIDISNNCPKVLKHTKTKNTDGWVGTELELLIAGNWTTYKSRILSYLQQLAIITPYAQFEMTYTQRSDKTLSNRKRLSVRYDRRSEQMPPLPSEIKHHPSSVNNVIINQLLERSNHRTVVEFLSKELSGVSPAVAKRIVDECKLDEHSPANKNNKNVKTDNDDEDDYSNYDSDDDNYNNRISTKKKQLSTVLTNRQITRLVQVLRTATQFKPPDASCLSPLGEYNLNLGILKVTEPEYVATARDKPSAYEGHPFLVEAAVSLGGKDAKEGIQVTRFANRIPLLFEGGADVCTRVAVNKIKWSSYKIDQKRDKIGVFVSIVSTKIPYKGTGKEYIGDDISEISISVKRALQNCCQQLRAHLQKRNALRDQKERKNKLSKYIPDVSRSLYDLLDGMRKRRQEQDDAGGISSPGIGRGTFGLPPNLLSGKKRLRLDNAREIFHTKDIMHKLEVGDITSALIKKRLEETVRIQNSEQEEEDAKKSRAREAIPLYLKPLFSADKLSKHEICSSFFTFRPIVSSMQIHCQDGI
jgi:DNA topoisomerase VI subunit B